MNYKSHTTALAQADSFLLSLLSELQVQLPHKSNNPKRLRLAAANSIFFVLTFISPAHAADLKQDNDVVILSADAAHPGRSIPPDFLGLSFEENDSLMHGQFENSTAVNSMASLMNRLGSGVLRLGGDSSDAVGWAPPKKSIEALGKFMGAVPHWALIFGLNLEDVNVNRAATVAEEVAAVVPSVVFQFGNEPDFYQRQGRRPQNYGVENYISEWDAYYSAVSRQVAGARIAGPDIALTDSWLAPFIASTKGRIVFASRHYYPFCAGKSATTDRLLSSDSQYPSGSDLRAFVNNSASIPVRLTETNSVCGGGQENVSDSLASAVWATEMLMQMSSAGVAGVNFHGGRVTAMRYSPFIQAPDGSFQPQPVYYGLLLFSKVVNTKLLPIHSSAAFIKVPAIAVLGEDGKIKYLVVNKSLDKPLRIKVWNEGDGGKATEASSLILTGNNPSEKAVTLGGKAVDSLGNWEASPSTIPRGKDVIIPPMSASLITLH